MEKYSSFSDPVTGHNPYIRKVRREFRVLDVFTSLLVFQVLYCLPCFLYAIIRGRLVTIKQSEIAKAKPGKKRVFACTSTSIFDPLVLHKVFRNPKLFMVTPKQVFALNRYSVYTKVAPSAIEAAASQPEPTVLFLSGGLTNELLLLDVTREAQQYRVEGFIALKYTPASTGDIGLFRRHSLPQFSSLISSLAYHFFFYLTSTTTPNVTIFTADTLPELAKRAKTEIAEGLTMDTTEQFLKVAALGQK